MRRGKFPVCLNLGHQFRNAATQFLAPVLFATGAFLAATNCSEAAPIYSQTTPADPSASFTSSNIINDQKIADNFFVAGTGQYTVRSLRVIGGYGAISQPPNPLPDDDFRIVFLNDAGDSPGTPLAGGDIIISSAVKRTPTGENLLNGLISPVEFVVDLGGGIVLDRGTAYWISVSNKPVPGTGWAWARASNVHSPLAASTFNDVAFGPWQVGPSSGMWFELDDANIPEPTSIALFVLLLVPATLYRVPSRHIDDFNSFSLS